MCTFSQHQKSEPSYNCGSYPIHLHSVRDHNSRYREGYVEFKDPLTFVLSRQEVMIKLPVTQGDAEKERHLLLKLRSDKNSPVNRLLESPSHYLVLEKYDHDLRFLMKSDVSVRIRKLLIPQIIYAIDFLHSHGVVHCDLKPANILLKRSHEADWKIVVSDFESAVDLTSPDIEFANDGTSLRYSPGWVCPEVFNGNVGMSASFEIDLFHLGLLIEVLTRTNCVESLTALPHEVDELNVILKPDYLHYKKTGLEECLLSEGIYAEVVKRLCSRNPTMRGNTAELKVICDRLSSTQLKRKVTV